MNERMNEQTKGRANEKRKNRRMIKQKTYKKTYRCQQYYQRLQFAFVFYDIDTWRKLNRERQHQTTSKVNFQWRPLMSRNRYQITCEFQTC